MKKIIAIIGTSIILSTVFLSGCNEQTNNNEGKKTFVGTWMIDMEGFEDRNETWIFKDDKSATHILNQRTDYFTWDDTGFELCIIPNVNPEGRRCGSYEFSDNYNTFKWIVLEQEIIFKRID